MPTYGSGRVPMLDENGRFPERFNAAETVVGAHVTGDDLVLEHLDSSETTAGNVRGPKGDKGDKGDVGPAGMEWRGAWDALTDYVEDDAVGHNGSAWFAVGDPVVGDEPGVAATWQAMAIKGSQGDQGIQGDPGPANVLTVGTTSTLPEGSGATVTIGGTSPAQTLSIGIPKGDTGSQGVQGVAGDLLPVVSLGNLTGNVDLSSYGATPVKLIGTLTGNVTVTGIPAAPASALSSMVELVLIQTGTNAYTVSWSGVDVRWPYASNAAPKGVAHSMSAGVHASAPASIADVVLLERVNGNAWCDGIVSRQAVKRS